jgi:hypothetical protein
MGGRNHIVVDPASAWSACPKVPRPVRVCIRPLGAIPSRRRGGDSADAPEGVLP